MLIKSILLAAGLAGVAALHSARKPEADPIATKVLDLGPKTDIWRAFDAPNGAFYVVDGQGIRIVRPNGSEIAHIENAVSAAVDAKRDRLAFLRSSDPAGTPMNFDHQFAWISRMDPASGRLVDSPHRATIHPCIYIDLSPDGSQMLCARGDHGTWSIYTIPSEGGDEHLVVSRPARTFEPVWSNDGKSIYYSLEIQGGAPRMERVPAAGGTTAVLPMSPGRPIGVSRDGKYFAVGTNKGPLVRVYDMRGKLVKSVLIGGHYPSWSSRAPHDLVSGVNDAPEMFKSISYPSGTVRELPGLAESQYSPTFAPDGTHLIYRATIGGRDQLVVADRDGAHARVLPTVGQPSAYWVSPDSRSISFVTPLLDSVYVLDIASGKTRALMSSGGLFDGGGMSWRSDGKAIIYGKLRSPASREIRQITLDGHDSLVREIGDFGMGGRVWPVGDTLFATVGRTGVRLLSLRSGATRTLVAGRASTGCIDCRLAVSSDSRLIGFELDDSTTGTGAAYVASIDGREKRSVGEPLSCGRSVLAWHPNGRDVFLYGFAQCDTTEIENVYAASLDGRSMRNLTASEKPGTVDDFAVSPDGSQIVYSVEGTNRASIYTLDLSKVLP